MSEWRGSGSEARWRAKKARYSSSSATELLIGCVGYREDGSGGAELGYWLGKPYWGHGYATEASAAMVAYAFDEGGLDYLTIGHFADNPASAGSSPSSASGPKAKSSRDCVARDEKARCLTYRLERGTSQSAV